MSVYNKTKKQEGSVIDGYIWPPAPGIAKPNGYRNGLELCRIEEPPPPFDMGRARLNLDTCSHTQLNLLGLGPRKRRVNKELWSKEKKK